MEHEQRFTHRFMATLQCGEPLFQPDELLLPPKMIEAGRRWHALKRSRKNNSKEHQAICNVVASQI